MIVGATATLMLDSRAIRCARTRSTEFDRLFDNVIEWRVLGRQGYTQCQFGAFKLSFANYALNFPLRGDPDHLED